MDEQSHTEPVGQAGARTDIGEIKAFSANGWLAVLVALALAVWGFYAVITASMALEEGEGDAGPLVLGTIALLLAALIGSAVRIISPGDTKVLQFFGKYVGTVRNTGLQMTLPLVVARKVSVKVRNFETNELKVNDADGNPVNIAAIVVWQVADTAKAIFAVEEFEEFIEMQAESALRHVASTHPYDNPDPGEESLRGSTDAVAAELSQEVAARVAVAGLEIVEVRISSLAYAPEIAHSMLQRQQAAAVIAAREQIVEGAVTMVQAALRRLEADEVVALDDERRAAMVSNLLVVLCGSAQATPVVNTGTLYS
ncbi:MAG: SPFH domain-containing protein [Propionibacteriaceae bacterium]|nr:SPFH domain-containing protein [Propionibacteriaceae bacterium]